MPYDPALLEIFKSLYGSVAEEMGVTLRRTAFSPNIKERRDYSAAVFDARGELVAQGDHMPVHLGSMPMSVLAATRAVSLDPGDVVVLNDPYEGGTHLPDVTMVSAVFERPASEKGRRRLLFYVANRAHHADIGGMTPGSMPLATEIFQEGLRIPPVKLYAGGERCDSVFRLLLANVRTPEEREGDLTAQIAANRTGERRLHEIVARYGTSEATRYAAHLQDYAERMARALVRRLPEGTYAAEDYLDDDGIDGRPIKIAARITIRGGELEVDFAGSDGQVRGSVNAVFAITLSAVYYVVRSLIPEAIPASSGILRPIRIRTPKRSVVDAAFPAAVCAGNVETSQRIVDVLLRALGDADRERIPAASSGTMNNLTIGGVDPRDGALFSYYETIGGGMGACASRDGSSGIHTHMTNTLNTPIEALEYAYPLRVRRYRLRRGTGGAGKFRGGDGIIRDIELLGDAEATLLGDRRRFPPYGLAGGAAGRTGRAFLKGARGTHALPSKAHFRVRAGERIVIETPGGGGWGKKEDRRRKTGDRRAK
jgi:N-methylhydantoinase B